MKSLLAIREHTRGAVLRCSYESDKRRFGAAFCARAGAASGTGCPM
jgi:hypothetical protein